MEEKGIITEREVEKVAKRLVESFRLKNILTPQELKDVRKALRNLKVPDPLGIRATAYSAYMYKIRDARLKVLPPDAGQRLYSFPDELEDLIMTLHFARFRNKKIMKKLEKSLALASRYVG